MSGINHFSICFKNCKIDIPEMKEKEKVCPEPSERARKTGKRHTRKRKEREKYAPGHPKEREKQEKGIPERER